jgi:cell pole-organizing protein PopZ
MKKASKEEVKSALVDIKGAMTTEQKFGDPDTNILDLTEVIKDEDAGGGKVTDKTTKEEKAKEAVKEEKATDKSKESDMLEEIDSATKGTSKKEEASAKIEAEESKLSEKKESEASAKSTQPEQEIKKEAEPATSEKEVAKVEPAQELKEKIKASAPIEENNLLKEQASRVTTPGLVAERVAQKSTDQLRDLLRAVQRDSIESMPFRSGNTLEDLVVELIKPELSRWLNNNLPTIVQRVVEKEIRNLIPRED